MGLGFCGVWSLGFGSLGLGDCVWGLDDAILGLDVGILDMEWTGGVKMWSSRNFEELLFIHPGTGLPPIPSDVKEREGDPEPSVLG